MQWQNRSACLAEDPDLFFPIGSTGDAVWHLVARPIPTHPIRTHLDPS